MNACRALVLGGGGARGALQVGAARALLQAGFIPDLLVGTSIGAVNAVGLALWGLDRNAIEALERAYLEIAGSNLMDSHLGRVMLRALLGRPNTEATRRVAEVLIAKGVAPDLRFDQVPGVRLAVIGADLDTGEPVIYGQDPSQFVLDGLLASIAVPLWFAPAEKDGRTIVDGGLVSNLPIEAAVTLGATEIIALDLNDPRPAPGSRHPVDAYLNKVMFVVAERYKRLEVALAEAQGVRVHCIELRGPATAQFWDFDHSRELMQTGYEIACRELPALIGHRSEDGSPNQAPV
jgi:NTE family protein